MEMARKKHVGYGATSYRHWRWPERNKLDMVPAAIGNGDGQKETSWICCQQLQAMEMARKEPVGYGASSYNQWRWPDRNTLDVVPAAAIGNGHGQKETSWIWCQQL